MESLKTERLGCLNVSKVACDHCHLEFDEGVMIEEGAHRFCCKGCQGVFHLLQTEGLDSFYEKLGDAKLAPPTQQFESSDNFDTPAFYERFVTHNDEGFCEVSLIIEGIHCAACVWLNEKALHRLDGVIEADINFTTNKARIVWSDETIKLSRIIDTIRAIGYDAFPYDPSLQEQRANRERKDYYLRMAVAGFALMNMMSISFAQYHGYFSGIEGDIVTILNMGEWVLSTPVLLYSGWVFFRGAYYGLRNQVVNMDLLVATGAVTTYMYSIYITAMKLGEAYFDSVTMIIAFVLFGKFLEVLSRKNAADTLDVITKYVPSEVMVVENGEMRSVKVSEVRIDDVVALRAGEKAALDGIVTEGEGSMDESSLTGESVPIYKTALSSIISGSVSIDAALRYRVTRDFAHSTLSHLMALLENAMRRKPRIEELANRISERFSSTILLLALLTFVGWYFWPHDFNTALMVGVSVIIIACPCALALATPVATLVGLGLGAKRGILFKAAAQLETLSQIDTVVFDKTGSLTEGRFGVCAQWLEDERDAAVIYAMAKLSKHPVSKGVARALEAYDRHLSVDGFEEIAALGVRAHYEGCELIGGNARHLAAYGIKTPPLERSAFYVGSEGKLLAWFELEDTIKSDAPEALEYFRKAGIQIRMLTGDHEAAARRVASSLGIEQFAYEQRPEAKEALVAALQAEGKKVMMVGDGINDILALSRADIGISMGQGSDIAIEVSDVVLLHDSLASLIEAHQIAKTTYRLIRQNLGLSLIYNAITIPLAMAGYIIPLVAAASMSLSSILVVLNSMRIRYSWRR
ncbi:MAG: cadmium-translocating P-type ATPase [Campylobacterales bacterium]|nr:cadmium-translocating P-type ATPase [Campylobacterales bacterium]